MVGANSPSTLRVFATGWFVLCGVISIMLVVVTGVLGYGSGPLHGAWFMRALSLASENNIGAWWSGILLALLSLHAFDGYAFERTRSPRLALAWATVAGLLLFLSADEIGSLHERLSQLGRWAGIGGWGFLLPLGAVMGLLLGRALLIFWADGGQRRKTAVALAIGFALLGSVAVQEYVQMHLVWQKGIVQALRVMVEEGTELAGMLVLLWVLRDNTAPVSRAATPNDLPTLAAIADFWRPLSIAAAIAAPLLTALTIAVFHDDRGLPSDWLAAVLFTGTALALLRPAVARNALPSPEEWAMIALCIAASVWVNLAPVSSGRAILGIEFNTRMLVLGGLGLLAAGIGAAATARRDGPVANYALLALFAATIPFVRASPLSTFVLSQVLALGTFAVIAHDRRALVSVAQPRATSAHEARRAA